MALLEIERHNLTQLRNMREGDLVEFDRGVYSHWAVYIGDETVVHVTSDGDSGFGHLSSCSHCCSNGREEGKIVVKKDNFWKVANNCKAFRNNYEDNKLTALPRKQIVHNALSKIGNISYNLLSQNCENFATFCRYGKSKSKQADGLLKGVTILGGLAVAGAFLGAIAAYASSRGSNEIEDSDSDSD